MSDNVTKFTGSKSGPVNALEAYSRMAMPTTVNELFDWGEWMWMKCGEYSQAINKIISYFLVGVDVTGVKGLDVKNKYKEYLTEELDIMKVSYDISKDLFTYGNSFVSVYIPFERILTCPKCKSSFPIAKVKYTFDSLKGGSFKGDCPSCKRSVTFKRSDTAKAGGDFRIIRWDPRDIHIEFNQITDECRYYYTPNNTVLTGIKNGDRIYMESTPWKVIQTVIQSKRLEFESGKIKHLKYDGVASFKGKLKGWGLPPFFGAFDQVVLLNLLKRYNEAILLDYLVPFRFLSPPKGGPGADPLLDIDAGNFMRSIEAMISEQRKNPSKIHSVPYPVTYQVIGGEAKQLAPTDLLKFTLETLYNTLGIPQEFFMSNLQTGGPPIALRIFERQHASYFGELESFMDWVGDVLTERKMWEKVKIKYIRTSVFEDEQTKEVKLQMLSSNKVSNSTALSPFGIDYADEIDRIIDEQQLYDQKMMEVQRADQKAGELQGQMDQPVQQPGAGGPGDPAMMQGGGAPPDAGGGAAPAAGPVPSGGQATMDETDAQAEQMAEEIMTMDPASRKSQLIQLSKTDETLHALVKEKLRKLERAAAQNGLNMTRAGQIPPPGQG